MGARWQGICLWAVALMLLSAGGHAQSVTPDQEYKKLIQVDTAIHPLGAHPFGEQVNLSTGELSFEETDVSLPGNGPLLQLSRTLDTTLGTENINAGRPFGDWDLDIPRIETATANQGGVTGWEVEATNPLQRCTYFGAPPDVPGGTITSADTWGSDQWWYGYHLIVPGEGSQTLLADGNSLSPTIGGQTYWISTKRNWVVGCGVTADDGGEGFLAIAPDGTRYTFAHLFYRPMSFITKPGGTPPDGVAALGSGNVQPQAIVGGVDSLARREAFMYVTKIQDRFGNTLTYHYNASTGYLSSITASDGREVDLTYVSGSPLIHSITAKATDVSSRTWTYSYDTTTNATLPTLTGVTLPDGSAWSYNLAGFQNDFLQVSFANCNLDQVGSVTVTTTTGTITTPSGLHGSFAEAPMLHGRSYVRRSCWGGLNPPQQVYFLIPNAYYQQSITGETITGAGLPTETWSYSYSAANQSWTTDSCASTNSCPSTIYTDVTDPDGHDVRYIFSNRFDATEGQLQRTNYYSGAAGSALLRSVTNVYANPTGGPWPTSYGIDLQGRDNYLQTEESAPLQQRTITQDGQNYTWQALAFDAYAYPTDVKRFNNIAGQTLIEESTTYRNDTARWVLSLPETVTNVGKGEVETSNTYNSLDELTARARFGQTLMHYTWNSAGQLASFTDGNSHTTTLGSYVRGIPTAIGYPDGTDESLAVDDLGQITAITDQGGNTTHYSYDALGRIARITYPYDSSVDSALWYPKTFTYSYVTGAERGLAANHWRRTTTQGAATDTTYFDAELRPVLDDTSNGSAHISTATGYDWRGLTTFASYPVSGSPALSDSTLAYGTHSTYDALGRLTQSQQDSELGALTTTTTYLPGPGTQVTDPKGNVTVTYDQAFDQPVYDMPWSISAPGGVKQSIARDIYGNPTAITQSGSYGTETDSYGMSLYYDGYRRLCRTTTEVETDSSLTPYSTVRAYDGANNLAWSADGLSITGTGCGQDQVADAAKTVRTYDAMNRVLTIQPPSGTQATEYTYDALGRVKSAISGIAIQSHNYNSLGLPTSDGLWIPSSGLAWSLAYGYDAYGHLSTVGYPAGTGTSETVAYAPNAWGQPTQVGNYVTGINYWPNGQVHSFTYGNGTSYLAHQNARQLTDNFTYGVDINNIAVNEDLAYDKDGNLTTVDDLIDGTRSKSYGYDALNRLTSAQAPKLYGAENYAYDALNNLRQEVISGYPFNLNPDAGNLLTSMTIGSNPFATYQNDAAGNRTAVTLQGNTTGYLWDAKHQLLGISSNGASVEEYAYDAAGRRIEKTPAEGSPTYSFYNHAGQLMYAYDPSSLKATNYIYLGTHLIARNENDNSEILGNIDGVSMDSAGNASLRGWACSTGLAQSIPVDFYVGGPAGSGTDIGRYTANQTSEPAVATACGVSSGNYRFNIPISDAVRTQYAGQPIYVHGISPVGNANLAIARSGSYTVPALPSAPPVPGAAPSLSVPGMSSTGSYTVSWGSVSTATSYTLQRSTSGGSSWSTAYTGSAMSKAISGEGNGTYVYRVEACNAGGCSVWSGSKSTVVTHPPASAPSLSVPATSSSGSYTVGWGSVSTATSYTLQQSSNGGSWSTAYSGGATSKALSGIGSGTYTYRVEACNAGGCGAWSATHAIAVALIPAAPRGLTYPTSVPYPGGNWQVSWPAVSEATSYALQRTGVTSGAVKAVYSGSATSAIDSLAPPGQYLYQVKACNANGCSPWEVSTVPMTSSCPGDEDLTSDRVQPDLAKCGSAATATEQGGTP